MLLSEDSVAFECCIGSLEQDESSIEKPATRSLPLWIQFIVVAVVFAAITSLSVASGTTPWVSITLQASVTTSTENGDINFYKR